MPKLSKEEFYKKYYPSVVKATEGTGLFPEMVIAQMALESGWGGSGGAKYNNMFGIKSHGKEGGVILKNKEEGKDKSWRRYDSPEDSIKDYVKFIQDNPTYTENGVFEAKTPQDQAKAMQKAGYAGKGNTTYADKVISTLNNKENKGFATTYGVSNDNKDNAMRELQIGKKSNNWWDESLEANKGEVPTGGFKEDPNKKVSQYGKDIPYVQGISDSIASLPNYEGIVKSPTADKFYELVENKNYDFGAKGIGNWTSADGGHSTSVDSIDCSGTICTVKNAQGADYDLTNTNAAKFKNNAKVSGIDPKDSVDGDMIVFQTGGDGTDHIGFVVVDEQGRRYIAESSSSYNGTTITPFDDRIKDLKSRHGKMTWDIVSDTENRPQPKPYNTSYEHQNNDKTEVRPAIKRLDKNLKESDKKGAIPQNATKVEEPIQTGGKWDSDIGEKVNRGGEIVRKDGKDVFVDSEGKVYEGKGESGFTDEEMQNIEALMDSSENAEAQKFIDRNLQIQDGVSGADLIAEANDSNSDTEIVTRSGEGAKRGDLVDSDRRSSGDSRSDFTKKPAPKIGEGGLGDLAKKGTEGGVSGIADDAINIWDLSDEEEAAAQAGTTEEIDIDALKQQLKENQDLMWGLENQEEYNHIPAEFDNDLGGTLMDVGRGIVGAFGASEPLPKYEMSDMFLTASEEASNRRNMGLSAEEIGFAKQMAERGYGYDVKNIRRMAGGSAGVALGNLGRATDQLYNEYGELAARDEGVRRMNRQTFYNQADKFERGHRQIFEDDLIQAERSKAAAAGLTADAIKNIKDRNQYNSAYGPDSQFFKYQDELTKSLHESRIDQRNANALRTRENINTYRRQNRDLEKRIWEAEGGLTENMKLGGDPNESPLIEKAGNSMSREDAFVKLGLTEDMLTNMNAQSIAQISDKLKEMGVENY